jgi:hypothetical protein
MAYNKKDNPIKGIKARIAERKEYKSAMDKYKLDLAKANNEANPRDLGGYTPKMPLSPKQKRQAAKGKTQDQKQDSSKSTYNWTVTGVGKNKGFGSSNKRKKSQPLHKVKLRNLDDSCKKAVLGK